MRTDNKKASIFPSYDAIYKKIQHEQTKDYEDRLKKVNSKIGRLKAKINFDEQHRDLAKKLINDYKKQSLYQKAPYQQFTDLLIVQKKRTVKYADSLNQYLQNSDEQQNNYEAHLKFRKKALQRQLQAAEDIKKTSKISKKYKQNQEEEEVFFKKLYQQFDKEAVQNKENIIRSSHTQKKDIHNRLASLKQNKKKLTDIYFPYVQALSNTNIVKWRILN